jgi:hypothetical protein
MTIESNDDFPKGPKSTWSAQARTICNQSADDLIPQIPLLLPWLQDYNWPGAHEIANLLLRLGANVAPHVKTILTRSSNASWKYWLIAILVCNWPTPLVASLKDELLSFAEKEEDEVHLVALEALLKSGLLDRDRGMQLILAKERTHPELRVDLDELKQLLNL